MGATKAGADRPPFLFVNGTVCSEFVIKLSTDDIYVV